jgi:hypothetical protein
MKVFISWSGTRGRHVADALRDWLPYVIHDIEPWASTHDLGAGERWSPAIARQLEMTQYGIVCVTKESLTSPWILFESGALAKSLDEGRLCPYLVDLTPAELDGPLAQFQAVPATREATLKLVQSIHGAMTNPQLSSQRLQTVFERFWPDLEEKLNNLPKTATQRPLRPDRALLEEILDHVRSLARVSTAEKVLGDFSVFFSDNEFAKGEYDVRINFESFDVQPQMVKFSVDGATPFQTFLDRLFTEVLYQSLEPYTYGEKWILTDIKGNHFEKNSAKDYRTLDEVGISKNNNLLTAMKL